MGAQMPKRRRTRLYWRERGGEPRAWGDFRDFTDVGGGREALIPPGESHATTDPLIAEKLIGDRLSELQERRRNRVLLGVERSAALGPYASHHLVEKRRAGNVTKGWLMQTEHELRTAVEFFGSSRDLHAIRSEDVQRWVGHLRTQPNGRGGTLCDSSVRHYLNALSNLYRRAAAEGYVTGTYNPVGAMLDKPRAARSEATWFEVPEVALLLEAARTHKPTRIKSLPFMYELFATLALTGGRFKEVMGLCVEDISFDRRTVTFRPNQWRRLKTSTSLRPVPLFPQLEQILRPYVFGGHGPKAAGLLFPSLRLSEPGPVTDIRKSLDSIAKRAGWKAGEVRTKALRHSFCAAALQTLDHGHPISEFTVAAWLGHGGFAMVRRIYGHLGTIRHRSDTVEFRVEQHRDRLGDRLLALAAERGSS